MADSTEQITDIIIDLIHFSLYINLVDIVIANKKINDFIHLNSGNNMCIYLFIQKVI